MNAASAMRLLLLLLVVAQISGCASPAQRIDDRAVDLGYRRVVVRGDGFSHVAYIKNGRATPNSALHIYLEGDGTPWVRKRVAASDPTHVNR